MRRQRYQRQQPLGDRLRARSRLRAVGSDAVFATHDDRRAREALDLDALSHMAQSRLAQRGQVLDLEEVVQRRRHALGAVDLAGAQALDQRLWSEVDQHHLVGRGQDFVGIVSRTRVPVSWVTWSLRLSRCCTLTVEKTSMPAASTSWTSS